MSGKIKAKDLSYDSSLPPFLQRLHAQNAGRGDQDRHERPIARPQRAKAHDDEDEPTVVDASGETLSKDDVAHLIAVEQAPSGNGSVEGAEDVNAASGSKKDGENGARRLDTKVTDGTASKKRKLARIVGDLNADDEASAEKLVAKADIKKSKKKAKPVKLAFDDQDAP